MPEPAVATALEINVPPFVSVKPPRLIVVAWFTATSKLIMLVFAVRVVVVMALATTALLTRLVAVLLNLV